MLRAPCVRRAHFRSCRRQIPTSCLSPSRSRDMSIVPLPCTNVHLAGGVLSASADGRIPAGPELGWPRCTGQRQSQGGQEKVCHLRVPKRFVLFVVCFRSCSDKTRVWFHVYCSAGISLPLSSFSFFPPSPPCSPHTYPPLLARACLLPVNSAEPLGAL